MATGTLVGHIADTRLFLETIWPLWHERRGDAVPSPNSRGTCGRSSLFLCKALRLEGLECEFAIGNPFDATGLNRVSPFGFFSGDRWESHAWAHCGGLILDITADQFGAPPIIVTSADDPRYNANQSDAAYPSSIAARHAAVESVWPQWLTFRSRRAFPQRQT